MGFSIKNRVVELLGGRDDTDMGFALGRHGEPHYRMRLTPEGTILKGNGLAAPTLWSPGENAVRFVPTAPNYLHRPQLTVTSSFAFPVSDFRMWWVDLPPGTIRTLGIHIATAGSADSRVRGVLYLPDGVGGLPNTLLKDCGQIDTSVAGNKTHTIPDGGIVWNGGPVWAGVHNDAGTTAAALTYAQGLVGNVAVPATLIAQTGNSWGCAKSTTFPTGPAPATFPGTGGFDQNPPIVAVGCW